MNDYLKTIINHKMLPKTTRSSPRQDDKNIIHEEVIQVSSKEAKLKQKRISANLNNLQEKINAKRLLNINSITSGDILTQQIQRRPETVQAAINPRFKNSKLINLQIKQQQTLNRSAQHQNEFKEDEYLNIRQHQTNTDINNFSPIVKIEGDTQNDSNENSQPINQNSKRKSIMKLNQTLNNSMISTLSQQLEKDRQYLQNIYGLNNDLVSNTDQVSNSFQFHNKALKQAYETNQNQQIRNKNRNRTENQRPSTQHQQLKISLQKTHIPYQNYYEIPSPFSKSIAKGHEEDNFTNQGNQTGLFKKSNFFVKHQNQFRSIHTSQQNSPRQKFSQRYSKEEFQQQNYQVFSNTSLQIKNQIQKQERILNNDQKMQNNKSKTIQNSPRLQLIEIGQININQDIRYYLEMMEQIKIENEQLKELNRKLVEELEIYRYKDSLKEAEYIIEHKYNNMLTPQRYKYLFESKQKYLQAINFSFKNEQELIQQKADSYIMDINQQFALEHEDSQQIISELMQQLSNINQLKEEAENNLEFISKDSVDQLKIQIDKYNEEKQVNDKLRDELLGMQILCDSLQARLAKFIIEQEKLSNDLREMSSYNKEMGKRIKKYQNMYHDVDINMIHEKITLLTTENDFYKNLSQKLQNANLTLKNKTRSLRMKQKTLQKSDLDIIDEQDDDEGQNQLGVQNKNDQKIPEEDQDKEEYKELVRPDFEQQLDKSNFSLMARF